MASPSVRMADLGNWYYVSDYTSLNFHSKHVFQTICVSPLKAGQRNEKVMSIFFFGVLIPAGALTIFLTHSLLVTGYFST